MTYKKRHYSQQQKIKLKENEESSILSNKKKTTENANKKSKLENDNIQNQIFIVQQNIYLGFLNRLFS